MPASHPNIIRIACRRTDDTKSDRPTRPGFLIGGADVEMLRMLAGRGDLRVAFVCRRRPVFEGSVKSILQRLVYVPGNDQWYLPALSTASAVPPAKRSPLPRWRAYFDYFVALSSSHR